MATKYPKSQTIEVCIADFENGVNTETAQNILKFNQAVNCYNFDCTSGALTESLGFEPLTIPSNSQDNCTEVEPQENRTVEYIKIAKYKHYDQTENDRIDKLIAITGENKVMFARCITPYPVISNIDEHTFVEVPNLMNYNDGTYDCVVFSSESDGVQSWDGRTEIKRYSYLTVVSNICEYNNRTFITMGGEKRVIRTEDGNLLTDWNFNPDEIVDCNLDAERGGVNKLITMDNYIIAIRDYGISRIKWYEEDKVFDVAHILYSGGRIYGETACNCGKFGLVLCKDGLYQFDTVSAKKIDLGIGNMLKGVSNTNAVASFRNGTYYLACKLNFADDVAVGCETQTDHKNNSIIAYHIATGKYTITRGIDVSSFCAIQYESFDKLLACFNTQYGTKIGQLVVDGLVFGQTQQKYWCSPLTDLGYSNKEKCVKEVSLLSKYDAKICVFTECDKREFFVKGSEILSKFPVRIKGKQVGISIFSDTQQAYISNVKLTVDLLDVDYV